MILVILIGTFITSLISGMFGMAGGVLLMGLYSFILPVSIAMILHGIAQAFSNGFRTYFFREHIVWTILPFYAMGAFIALCICFWISYIPSKEFIFFVLGSVAVISVSVPITKALDIEKKNTAIGCGLSVTFMQIFSGVSGPLLDVFYLNSNLTRYQIIANKSLTQTLGHILKLVYYGTLLRTTLTDDFTLPYWILPAIIVVTFAGARSGKLVVKFINDAQFRKVTKYLIFILGVFYLYKGMEEGGHTDQAYAFLIEKPLVAMLR